MKQRGGVGCAGRMQQQELESPFRENWICWVYESLGSKLDLLVLVDHTLLAIPSKVMFKYAIWIENEVGHSM
jgi:hypothetical protein